MYLPAAFREADVSVLHALMREHPLAALVSTGPEGITSDHLPLEFDAHAGAHGTLYGHVARANPLWRHAAGAPVLAVFRGAQAYVSPSWYPGKTLTHKVVPTWNYAVVHAHGTMRVVEDATWLRALVSRLTRQHESVQATPWSVDDAPEDFVQQMLRAVVGIEVEVLRLEGKFKLSQNRPVADRQAVASALQGGDAQAQGLAHAMRQALDRAG